MRLRFNEREALRNREGYSLFETTVDGVEVFVNETELCARLFTGKRTKSDWAYRFKNIEAMTLYIDREIKKIFDRNESKRLAKEKDAVLAKENRKNVNVGDVFHTSWGYEQTNVDFVQVVARKSATKVVVRAIGKITVEETSWCSDRVRADIDNFIGEEKIVTIDKYGNLCSADRYGNRAYKGEKDETFHRSWGY